MDTETIHVFETASSALVEAVLHLRLTVEQVVAAEMMWKPHREAIADEIEHPHWDWSRKTDLLGEPGVRFLGVEFGSAMQGMIALWEHGHVARLPAVYGQPLVYVEYLEAAPWNVRLPGRIPRYRAVGSRLVGRAASLSTELGFSGRVGLVALPQAEEFYEQGCGMTPVGQYPEYNGLMYYRTDGGTGAAANWEGVK